MFIDSHEITRGAQRSSWPEVLVGNATTHARQAVGAARRNIEYEAKDLDRSVVSRRPDSSHCPDIQGPALHRDISRPQQVSKTLIFAKDDATLKTSFASFAGVQQRRRFRQKITYLTTGAIRRTYQDFRNSYNPRSRHGRYDCDGHHIKPSKLYVHADVKSPSCSSK